MKVHFLKLLDYNFWANRLFMIHLADSSVINNKIFLLFSHVLTAEEIWLCRAKGVEAPLQRLWQEYPTATLQQMLQNNAQEWPAYLSTLEEQELEREIPYKNSKGEQFQTRLDDIVTHLVNHGTHHRAQIASMLQQEKVQPPLSDYIIYIREQRIAVV